MLSDHAIKLLEERYLLKDEDGNITETPDEFFVRVAKHGAKTDEEFWDNLEAISNFKFVPSRMPYMGTERPFCSSCFVLGPIEDDTDSILDVLKQNVAVQRYGGGAGFNFSRLRPQGDVIKKTKGRASGPVSFMQLYDSAMRVFLRAGNKMGAQMAVLNVDHPDIEKFITCKDKEGELTTFNISVAVSDSFMQAVNEDSDWDLVFGGKVYKTVKAKDLWRKLTYQSWKNGEPGIIFIDTVNGRNKYPVEIEASNPCGEQFLPSSASCNLGSINLSKFVSEGVFDWEQFEKYIRIGVRFLDTSLERAWWPLDEVRETTLKYKNVGLGVMGFSDALIQMGIPYDSNRAIVFANNVGEFLITVARDESDKMGSNNTTLTAIAPTGSIATLAGCSYGIEPIFAVSFTKNTLLGSVTQLNEHFVEIAKRRGFYTEELVTKIEKSGSVQDIPEVPQDVKDVFKTAGEISVDRHVEIQAAFQKHVCNAISKTINLSNSATVEEVGRVYMLAYNSGCKSTTVYRDGSRVIQAMDAGKDKTKEQKWELYISDPGCISGTCSI